MTNPADIDKFISQWRDTGGSELANTQSFINGLCDLLEVEPPTGSRTDDVHNDYVFERRVFQDNGDGTQSFGRIDCYKRGCYILEAKQGSEADRAAADKGEDDRTAVFELMRDLYTARSTAVHTGKFPKKKPVDLDAADRLVAGTLRAIVERGGFPDWKRLALGGE